MHIEYVLSQAAFTQQTLAKMPSDSYKMADIPSDTSTNWECLQAYGIVHKNDSYKMALIEAGTLLYAA